jgi:hypothetical protein
VIVDLIDAENWSAMGAAVKGDAYEALLERNAQDIKSGAGQYFPPRALILAMAHNPRRGAADSSKESVRTTCRSDGRRQPGSCGNEVPQPYPPRRSVNNPDSNSLEDPATQRSSFGATPLGSPAVQAASMPRTVVIRAPQASGPAGQVEFSPRARP